MAFYASPLARSPLIYWGVTNAKPIRKLNATVEYAFNIPIAILVVSEMKRIIITIRFFDQSEKHLYKTDLMHGIKNSLKPTMFELFGNGIIKSFNFLSWYMKINSITDLKTYVHMYDNPEPIIPKSSVTMKKYV